MLEPKNADLMKVECRMMATRDWDGFMCVGGDKESLVIGCKHQLEEINTCVRQHSRVTVINNMYFKIARRFEMFPTKINDKYLR